MALSFRQLEIVHAVSRHGSVSRAADMLSISQPAVSMMLRECTRAAGFPLFVRKQGRLQPTEETRGLLAELERVFDGVERVNRLVVDLRDVSIGSVQIAVTPTLAENIIPQAVKVFQEYKPRIRITVHNMDNLSVVNTVVDDRVDFGMVLSPLNLPDARLVELCQAELICVVSPDHPLAHRNGIVPRDIAPYPLISFSRNLPLGALVDQIFEQAGVPRRIALEVNQSSVACSLARAGVGVAIVDPFWVFKHSIRGLVRLRVRPRVVVTAHALIPHNKSLSRPARMFLATIRRTAENLRASGAF
jgi:DNA-binding transcriptional LysR family regulator